MGIQRVLTSKKFLFSILICARCVHTSRTCFDIFLFNRNRNRNRKLDISRAPTKAKSREPAYSQALYQNRIDRQGGQNPESQAGRQSDG